MDEAQTSDSELALEFPLQILSYFLDCELLELPLGFSRFVFDVCWILGLWISLLLFMGFVCLS